MAKNAPKLCQRARREQKRQARLQARAEKAEWIGRNSDRDKPPLAKRISQKFGRQANGGATPVFR
jgi:hypothetical protein